MQRILLLFAIGFSGFLLLAARLPAAAGPAPSASWLRGMVKSAEGAPVADARVRITGEGHFVTTDQFGRFELPLANPRMKWFQLPLSAGKEGWLNGSGTYRPGGGEPVITLNRIPDGMDYPDYRMMITSPDGFIPPSMGMMQRRDCGNCHTTHLWEWGSSKMGKTVKNDRVLESYKRFVEEKRSGQQNSCADCHAPIAALRSPGNTDYALAVATGANLSKGIECDFCHKIRDVSVSNRPGVQALHMTRVSLGQGMMSPMLAYGPYDDVANMAMAASYNSLFTKSEFCSSCHQSAVPLQESWAYRDVYPQAGDYPLYENGSVLPDQWTYQEWLEWQDSLPEGDQDKGRQCQDCHMNWTKDMVPYYRYVVSGRVRSMGVERPPESISPHKFEGATPARLEGAVRMQVDAKTSEGLLDVNVDVTNVNAGHRLPTGEHTRNMILLVRAEKEDGGQLEQIDGPVVPDWGGTGKDPEDVAGLPGKGFARITEDAKGRINVPVWQATAIVSDNRIRAKQTDTSNYTFRLPQGWQDGDPLYVIATLVYRSDFRNPELPNSAQPADIVMQEASIEVGDGGL